MAQAVGGWGYEAPLFGLIFFANPPSLPSSVGDPPSCVCWLRGSVTTQGDTRVDTFAHDVTLPEVSETTLSDTLIDYPEADANLDTADASLSEVLDTALPDSLEPASDGLVDAEVHPDSIIDGGDADSAWEAASDGAREGGPFGCCPLYGEASTHDPESWFTGGSKGSDKPPTYGCSLEYDGPPKEELLKIVCYDKNGCLVNGNRNCVTYLDAGTEGG